MAQIILSKGFVEAIFSGKHSAYQAPVVQVSNIRRVEEPNPSSSKTIPSRSRVSISDCEHLYPAVLFVSAPAKLCEQGEIDENAIVSLETFNVTAVKNTGDGKAPPVVVVSNVKVIKKGSLVGGPIGHPVSYKPDMTKSTAAPLTSHNGGSNVVPTISPMKNTPGQLLSSAQGRPGPLAPSGLTSSLALASISSPVASRPALGSASAPGFGAGKRASVGGAGASTSVANTSFGAGGVSASQAVTKDRLKAIASLNPYLPRWTIRGRVTNKGQVKSYSNAKGEGKLFSFTVMDESGDIRVTGFRETVDKFYEMIQVAKVYYIANASLKPANKQFNSTQHEYEMTLNHESQIEPCDDSDPASQSLPQVSFNFVKIKDLRDHFTNNGDHLVDVTAVVVAAGDVTSITARQTNKELKKREIKLIDDSIAMITLVLWNNDAEQFDSSKVPTVIVAKAVRISEFQGALQLSTLFQSQLFLNSDIDKEALYMRGWYEENQSNLDESQFVNLSSGGGGGFGGGAGSSFDYDGNIALKCISEINAVNFGVEKAEVFFAKAQIVQIRKERIVYPACTSESCNKKMQDRGDGTYRCEKCNIETDKVKWRLLVTMNIADETDSYYVTCFNEEAEKILGVSAEDVGNFVQSQDMDAIEVIIQRAQFTHWIFKLRAKQEHFNDETRLKVVVVGVQPVDDAKYGRRLVNEIRELVGTAGGEGGGGGGGYASSSSASRPMDLVPPATGSKLPSSYH